MAENNQPNLGSNTPAPTESPPRTYFPTCPFCGSQQLPDAQYESQEIANEAAAMRCDCYKAKQYQADVERKQEREKNIVRMRQRLDDLAKYCEARGVPLEGKTHDLLMLLGTSVLDGEVAGASLKWARLKVNISINNKGAISIGFTYSDSAKVEV